MAPNSSGRGEASIDLADDDDSTRIPPALRKGKEEFFECFEVSRIDDDDDDLTTFCYDYYVFCTAPLLATCLHTDGGGGEGERTASLSSSSLSLCLTSVERCFTRLAFRSAMRFSPPLLPPPPAVKTDRVVCQVEGGRGVRVCSRFPLCQHR